MLLTKQQAFSEKNVIKLLKKTVKKVILDNQINPNTKKGNKELDFLIKRFSSLNYSSLEQIQEQGEKIGNIIVELSKERGKTHLDRGIIQQIILKKEIPAIGQVPIDKTSVISKSKTTSAVTVVPPKSSTPVRDVPVKEVEVIPPPIAEIENELDEEVEGEILPVAEVELDREVEEKEEIAPIAEVETPLEEAEEEEIPPISETQLDEEIPSPVTEVESELDEDEEDEELPPIAATELEEIPSPVTEVESEFDEDEEDEELPPVAATELEEIPSPVTEVESELDEDEEDEELPPIAATELEEIPSPVTEVESEFDEDEEDEELPPVAATELEEIPSPVTEVESEFDEDEEDEELPPVATTELEEEMISAVGEEPIKAVEATQENASMSLKERIGEDIKAAMKAQDKIRLETVRSIKKVIIEKEVAVRPSGQDSLTPEQEIEVLTQQAKQRRDSIEQFKNAGRDELADKEAQELAIIETYLPKQLSDAELTEIIDEIIASTGATSVKDLGRVMGVAIKQLKGKADGKKIQELVKNQLS
jgi:hypothetical protein